MQLAARRLVKGCLQLIDVGFIGEVALRFGQAKNEFAAFAADKLGLRGELADDAAKLQAGDKCRPLGGSDR